MEGFPYNTGPDTMLINIQKQPAPTIINKLLPSPVNNLEELWRRIKIHLFFTQNKKIILMFNRGIPLWLIKKWLRGKFIKASIHKL